MARKPHAPTEETRRLVTNLALVGYPQEVIAKQIGISRPTLVKHYREELDFGGYGATAMVAGRLFKKALDGDTASMVFWMKSRGNWKEGQKPELEITADRGWEWRVRDQPTANLDQDGVSSPTQPSQSVDGGEGEL